MMTSEPVTNSSLREGNPTMTKRKTVRSVLNLARLTSECDEDLKDLESQIRRRQVIKKLVALRAAKGLSQQDIAQGMGVTQSKVSKLEASDDDSLNLEDFRGYLNAMDLSPRMIICPKEWPLMEQVKFFAFSIRGALNRMVELARTSESVRNAEASHIETLCNMAKLIVDSAKNLPGFADEAPDVFDAETDIDDMNDCGAMECEQSSA